MSTTNAPPRRRFINMMLSRRYCADWDLFEIFREMYANMLDADPDFELRFPSTDHCIMRTRSHPTLTEMLVMGAGTKGVGTDTIGQFGEGAKVAANAAARRKNTRLIIRTPKGEFTFSHKTAADFDEPTLHACLQRNGAIPEGCEVELHAKDVHGVYTENFIDRSLSTTYGAIKKSKGKKGMRIYVRGILIKRIDESSLYDWNVEHVKLNRDRSVPDAWDLKYRIGKMVDHFLTKDNAFADEIVRGDSYESKALEAVYQSDEGKAALKRAFERKYGSAAVLATSNSMSNQQAAARGHSAVAISSGLASALVDAGVKRATDVVDKSDNFKQVPPDQIDPTMMAEVTALIDLLEIPAEIRVFEDNRVDAGRAVFNLSGTTVIVWLNENLFQPGQRRLRLSTVCHELAHIKSKDTDGTLGFEYTLDEICGRLATAYFNLRFSSAAPSL